MRGRRQKGQKRAQAQQEAEGKSRTSTEWRTKEMVLSLKRPTGAGCGVLIGVKRGPLSTAPGVRTHPGEAPCQDRPQEPGETLPKIIYETARHFGMEEDGKLQVLFYW